MGWEPIETAPKDGTQILAYGAPDGVERIGVVSYEESTAPDLTTHDGITFEGKGWCWYVEDGGFLHKECFSHWMPLPTPPKETPDDQA